jgi:hypothetical protein
MALEQLGSIGEFVGAIAVVISLVYLATQIRQNTRAVRSSAHQGIVQTLDRLMLTLANSPDLAHIWTKAHADESSLSPEEEIRLWAFINRVFGTWENIFFQRKQGLVDEEMWETYGTGFIRLATTPPYQRFWQAERGSFIPAFRKHVDDVAASRGEAAQQGLAAARLTPR